MKILFGFIILIFSLFILIFCININATQPDISIQQEIELVNYVIPINSIESCDINFSDFRFLESVLEDKKIVLLGESLHFDGSSFLAKTRLIKFLHEYLGYDVLLWEVGLFNVWYMNEELKKKNEFEPSLAMFRFWYKTLECKELWKYFNQQQKTSKPVKLEGFDLQFSGIINDTIMHDMLVNFLSKKDVEVANYKHFNSILYHSNWINEKKVCPEKKDSILIDLNKIVETIKPQIYTFEDSIFFRYLSQSIIWANCTWKYNIGDAKRTHLRDSIMADNLIWLVDKHYPDQKIIVWASNMHILYNNSLYKHETNIVSMGEYIKNRYGNQSYTIVISSFGQLSDRNTIFRKGGNKSIEYILHKNKIRYGFLDFRSIPASSFLHDDIIMRVNHSQDIKGKWSFMTDGLFYIDTMQQAHY